MTDRIKRVWVTSRGQPLYPDARVLVIDGGDWQFQLMQRLGGDGPELPFGGAR